MKRQILFAFFASLMLMLSGCGSNDKLDGGSNANAKAVEVETSMGNSGRDFTINAKITKTTDYTVALKNFELFSVGGCKIDSVTVPSDFSMAGGKNSYQNVQFSGKFESDCTPSGHKIRFTQTISNDSRSKTEMVTYDSTASSGGSAGGGGSTADPFNGFFNATTPLTISKPNQAYPIKVQVLEKGYAVEGKTVRVKSFYKQYGEISNPTTNTGADGYAVFNYTSPATLPANGSSVTIELTNEENGTVISQDIVLNFETSGSSGGNAMAFSFLNETGLTVTTANKEYALSIDLIDSTTGVGVSDKSVSITTIGSAYGTITPATTATNSAGKAIFSYKSPQNLVAGSTAVTFRFEDENHNVITKEATITIVPPSGGGSTGIQYAFINETNLTVTAPETTYPLFVDLINSTTGVGAPGKDVTITVIPQSLGSITPSVIKTNDSGRAIFSYTSPAQLSAGLTMATLAFVDENGNRITREISISIVPASGGDIQYSFANESNLTIEHPDDQIDIKVQLRFKGIPIEGKTVQMEGFDVKYGSVFSYTVVTDAGGYATFAYTAPSTGDFDEVNGTTQTFKILFKENDKTAAETNATISFDKQDTSIIVPDKPIVVLPQEPTFHPLIIDANNKNVDIDIKVFKNGAFYTGGVVKVALPDEAIKGADVGLFDEYNVSIDSSGIAKFKYNGPSNLLQTLSSPDIDNNNSIFTFYHIENNITSGTDLTVEFRVPADTLQNRNYTLDVITNGEYSMGIPEQTKTFNVVLKAQDASGNPVGLSDENITKITVTSENAPIAQLLDGNATVDTLELVASTFTLRSKTLSGLVPIKVKMEFVDADGKNVTLETIVNVRVFSGPPSAISISYVSTGQDKARAKYEETLAISATDEYGNKVNTRPNISVGAIVGYAVDGREADGNETSATKRLFYGRSDIVAGAADGEIKELGDNDVATTNFEDNTPARSDVFQYVNAEGNNTDKLVVFGERKNYEAMGKWDISKGADNHTLALKDNYFGIDRSGLYYAVGHNYYQDQCREDGREWIGTTDSESYKLDEEGTVTVTYKYDYHLAGKDALIWVNLDGIQPDTGIKTRVGEATKHTLRSTGLVSAPSGGYSVPKGTRALVEFYIWHEKAPERYRNAHFGYTVAPGSTCVVLEKRSSNPFDARVCDNRQGIYGDADNNATTPDTLLGITGNTFGGAYVTFYLQAPEDKDCTFNIGGIVVSSEF